MGEYTTKLENKETHKVTTIRNPVPKQELDKHRDEWESQTYFKVLTPDLKSLFNAYTYKRDEWNVPTEGSKHGLFVYSDIILALSNSRNFHNSNITLFECQIKNIRKTDKQNFEVDEIKLGKELTGDDLTLMVFGKPFTYEEIIDAQKTMQTELKTHNDILIYLNRLITHEKRIKYVDRLKIHMRKYWKIYDKYESFIIKTAGKDNLESRDLPHKTKHGNPSTNSITTPRYATDEELDSLLKNRVASHITKLMDYVKYLFNNTQTEIDSIASAKKSVKDSLSKQLGKMELRVDELLAAKDLLSEESQTLTDATMIEATNKPQRGSKLYTYIDIQSSYITLFGHEDYY